MEVQGQVQEQGGIEGLGLPEGVPTLRPEAMEQEEL